MVTVGIPRALLYYQYFPMWETFLNELGAEVVVSPATTKAMVTSGSSLVVADTCLPVKIFLGHVLSLVDKCDFMFIPVIRSIKRRIYNCAKFLGLPDMTRAVIPRCPPILDIEIDVNKGERRMYQAVNKLGRHFTSDTANIRRAAMNAWQAHLNYRRFMSDYGLTPLQAMPRLSGTLKNESGATPNSPASTRATIALIGHPYLLYDEYLNHRLIHRLQSQSRVLTPEMLEAGELETAAARLAGSAYWTFGDEVVGAGERYLQDRVDGVIGVMTFGCGPDSLLMDMVRHRAAALRTVPFMGLTLEEHTAETGVITRLEAFLDMINRKKRGS